MSLRHTYGLIECPHPSEEDETEGMTPDEVHLSFLEYWDRCAARAGLERFRGYRVGLSSVDSPEREVVMDNVGLYLERRTRDFLHSDWESLESTILQIDIATAALGLEEEDAQAAIRASLARSYRRYREEEAREARRRNRHRRAA